MQGKYLLITGSEAIVVPQISVIGVANPNSSNFHADIISIPCHSSASEDNVLKDLIPRTRRERVRRPKREHRCKVCNKSFATSTKLNNHSIIHSDERPFSCSLCAKSFKMFAQVKRHMTVHINEGVTRANVVALETSVVAMPKPNIAGSAEFSQNNRTNDLCVSDLDGTVVLEENTEKGDGLKGFQCEICLKQFTYAHHLRNHKLQHLDENEEEILLKVHSCPVCNKCFPTKTKLALHMPTHSDERPFTCNLCPKSYKVHQLLKMHINTHTTPPEFKCELCEKAFRTKHLLSTHKNIHSGVLSFICDVCGKQFRSKAALKLHINSTHKNRYSCSECRVDFKTKQTYVKHQNHHKGIEMGQNHVCSVCQKAFESNSQLQQHSQIHDSTSNKWVCDVCGKVISTKQCLRIHKFLHEGVKPHKCIECGKAFARKPQLQIHMRIHTGERPYACNVCSKRFAQRTTLVMHMRFHSGERPYTCDVCQKGFITGSLLKIHKLKIHKNV